MKETTFYLLLVVAVVAAFYYGIPQKYLGEFATFFSNLGSSISYR